MNRKAPLPNWTLVTAEDIGRCVRDQRKAQGATQSDLAALCGVGIRFISELENGKPTAELGKVLQLLKCLGLEISARPRHWESRSIWRSE
ncbi:helix-turn-helix transcriptional regulator [Thioalbus denitrificans]|uniref:Y4mF family transcriptional regulator n=1 Tax=Thioalbus denitrificans TaxID=547122 RepID=A0A369BR75_9GAMM|nr:helix-turn-helix transcriptional regulator [Thioalbus denitrificans]RCX23891.1 y4mF family transcriptional regulator [Thioalbus denitrificans]